MNLRVLADISKHFLLHSIHLKILIETFSFLKYY